jgi:anti-sigma B factor antagonist
LSGRITLGEGSVVLRDAVKDLLGKGQKKILLNLGDVSYIDSSGIGELVSAFTSVRNQGGELKLLHLTKKVHDLLQITKLYTVFDVKDDEDARKVGDIRQLEGRQIEITGMLKDYRGRAEIVLRRTQQLGESAFVVIPQVPTDYDAERQGHYSAGKFSMPKEKKNSKKQGKPISIEDPEEPE